MPVKIFSDYPDVDDKHSTDPRFVFVAAQGEADVLFTVQHVRDFIGLRPTVRVNQFPFEACLIRKDMLPLTARTISPTPAWYLQTYDLRTEAAQFIAEFSRRRASGHRTWIVKPAQAARAARVYVSDDLQAILRRSDPPLPDQIVQLYVRDPMLIDGRKFDLRVFVCVLSFAPFKAYVQRNIYARLAPKKFAAADNLHDLAAHVTICLYDPDPVIAAQQDMLTPLQLQAELASAGHSWGKIEASIHAAIGELFRAASPIIGEWPRSRAVYGVDVMLDAAGSPYILEVNFCPDFGSPLRRVHEGYPHFIDNLLSVLFTDSVPDTMTPL